VIYPILAFVIVFPLLLDKFLFLLDYIPRINGYNALQLFYGFTAPVYGGSLPITLLSAIIPAEIFQKFLIFLILFLSGYLMYSLASKFTSSKTAQLYAGLLYMLNPYTYIRIVVGHWLILFAYAILPLAVKYLIELLDKKDLKNTIKFTLATTLVAFNSHTLFIALIVFSILFLSKLCRDRSISLFKSIISASLFFLLLNTYWLVPLFTAKEETLLSHISLKDIEVFSPKESLFGIMGMYGFWKVGYIYAKDLLSFWHILFLAIFILAVYGFTSFRKNRYVLAFGFVWLIGFALATGIKGPLNDIFKLLFEYTPLKGMRDTHKFVTMLAFSYSILGALGLTKLEEQLKNLKPLVKYFIILIILLIPLIYSFTFFNGFAGQIKPTDFPKDWYEVKEFLNKDKDNFRVLFFPWHLYMTFHWVPNRDKLIANPAPLFFDREVISGKNIEIPGVYRQVYTPYQVYIDYLLGKRNKISNFGELVSILGVKYILLTKEVDYKKYFFLLKQKDLELVLETKNFYVFKNKAFKGLIFSVDGIGYVKDWDELINISKIKDITRRLYVIGEGEAEGREFWVKLKYEKVSPVKYVIKDRPMKYVIFTEEYSKDWKLNGEEPLKAYGVVNAYVVLDKSKPKEIVYERFYRICLPFYIISLVAFLGCVYLFYDWRREKGDRWTERIEEMTKD